MTFTNDHFIMYKEFKKIGSVNLKEIIFHFYCAFERSEKGMKFIMNKLYDVYKKLKNENKEDIYLFKNGIFYIALDADATFLNKKYNLKLTNLNNDIVKCGFPCSSFDKYYILFTNDNIKFRIIENNIIFNGKDYLKNQEFSILLDKIENVNIDNLSVSEAYNFIEEIQKDASKLRNKFYE